MLKTLTKLPPSVAFPLSWSGVGGVHKMMKNKNLMKSAAQTDSRTDGQTHSQVH